MRRIITIFLLLCLPMYGFAMHGGLSPANGLPSLAHAVEHDEGISHHHEEDGSVHYDASDESLDHAQEHSCSPQAASISVPTLSFAPGQRLSERAALTTLAVPEPFLDGPRKPPRHAPGHAAGGSLHT